MLIPLGDGGGASSWTVRAPDGRSFAVFVAADGSLRVTDAACPHNGGPLVDGRVRDGAVVCPWHWYRFDLDDGTCRTTDQHALAVHPVVERDGVSYADVGDPPPAMSWSERLRAHARDG